MHWSKKWENKDFVKNSPYLALDALQWLIDKKPFLIGGDIPRWELAEKPQGIFKIFKDTGVLLNGTKCKSGTGNRACCEMNSGGQNNGKK